ncbi:hypothetical protein B0H17DRAFT_1140144 [Mycena rosella]|uniref:Uncharacterized protein n=1 Tax=Mycena rosella TaxID=1033263 RepID=A0AAD7GAE8_MYCRO|nr:hypothetical protein B0H17DRAFT_1140144 [Mycena rosella]
MPAKHTRRNCAAPETPNQGATPKQARIGDLPAMIVARNRPSHVSEEYASSSVPNSFSKVENNDEKQPPSATALLARTLQSCNSVKVQPTATKYSVAVQGQGIATKLSTNMNKSAVPHHRHQSSSDIADGQGSVVTDIGVDEKRNSS